MCEKHYYYAQRGNKVQTETETKLCVNSHHNRPCRQALEFHHNRDEKRGTSTFPPSPPLSDVYSGSDGERTRRRRSSVYYPSNADNGVEINRKSSQRRKSVVIEDPYRPVTPPTTYYSSSPPHRSGVHIEISNTRIPQRGHGYHHSPKSSRDGASNASEEERIQKLERDLAKTKEALRRQKMQSKIERQNDEIANRPAVPQAPQAPRPYRRGSVSVQPPMDQLTDAMKHVRIGNQTAESLERERRRRDRRAQEELEKREEAAQRDRLRARMDRRNSTAAVYDDERYRRQY